MASVLRVTLPVTLDLGDGIRITITRDLIESAGAPARRGRKPGPATQKVIAAMQADHAAGKQRTAGEYQQLLVKEGTPPGSAYLIARREAKRIFGASLKKRRPRPARNGHARGGGRQPATHVVALRKKISEDVAKGDRRDAAHYVRWLVDHANIGLKRARPVVYRELRNAA